MWKRHIDQIIKSGSFWDAIYKDMSASEAYRETEHVAVEMEPLAFPNSLSGIQENDKSVNNKTMETPVRDDYLVTKGILNEAILVEGNRREADDDEDKRIVSDKTFVNPNSDTVINREMTKSLVSIEVKRESASAKDVTLNMNERI